MKGPCCSLISATRRNLKTPTLMRSFFSCSSIFCLNYGFGGHVVLGSRALKTLNRSFFTLTGQLEKNSYTSLNHISSIPRQTELDRLSRRKSLLSTTTGQNGYWMMDKYFKPFKTPEARVLSDIIFFFAFTKTLLLVY